MAILLRSAAVQVAAVVVMSLLLGLALPHSFFEVWGWLTGPAAWVLCAMLTARVLELPVGITVVGAVLAGVPSLVAVLLGLHWLGVALAVALFAIWCARLPRQGAAWSG